MRRLQRRVQARVPCLLRLVEIDGRVMELEIGELLRMARAARARHIHGTTLLVLAGPNVVRVGDCPIARFFLSNLI